MPLIELSTALVAAGSSVVVPFVNKVLEKTASRWGEGFDASLVTLFVNAHSYLAVTEREVQPVEPKLLKHIVENAPLENDETLSAHWAALLANAADSAQQAPVQPGFADVLRQLTSTDAQVLKMLYAPAGKTSSEPAIGGILTKMLLVPFGLGYEQVCLTVDNLLRMQLCRAVDAVGVGMMPATIAGTTYGHHFMKAVTPPIP